MKMLWKYNKAQTRLVHLAPSIRFALVGKKITSQACRLSLFSKTCASGGNYINREKEIIPINSIVKPPSAELRPDQKDSDSLPDYDILDKILFEYIELKKSSKDIIESGYDQDLVDRILKMVNKAEFKRYQTPPILRVTPKAFGMGRRMPIVGKYLS
jgi:NH3-dependent NAD+ synthetase